MSTILITVKDTTLSEINQSKEMTIYDPTYKIYHRDQD